MQRFGRTAQQRMKDRWGGSFVLATILALVGAWFAGNWLNTTLNGTTTGTSTGSKSTSSSVTQSTEVKAEPFNLYFVQVGAFRSESSAKNLAKELSPKYMAMVGNRTKEGFYPVYAGMFTDAKAASDTRERLVQDGHKSAFTSAAEIKYDPVAVAAMATGNNSVDMKTGMDLMNSYLHEVAMWMEHKAAGTPSDTAALSSTGHQLADLASKLATATDPKMQALAKMAANASQHASALENAVNSTPSDEEYQAAVSGYMKLLDDYRNNYK